jgi:hypothetical protein
MPDGSSAGWLEQAERDECEKNRMVADEQVQRKRTTTKYIMDRVKSMKHELKGKRNAVLRVALDAAILQTFLSCWS